MASAAVIEAARARRLTAADARLVRIQWFLDNVVDKVRTPLKTRTRMAAEWVRDKCVKNISRPVTKAPTKRKRGKGQYTKVTDRSKPGEYFKADTTLSMKSLFTDVKEIAPGVFEGYVGTPLDYNVILQLRMKRKFLIETLAEERETIVRILTGPIR